MGRKSQRRKLAKNQHVSIGEFVFKFNSINEKRIINKTIDAFSPVVLIAGNHPYISSLAIVSLFVLLILGGVVTVSESHYKSVFTKQEIERATFIAKNLRDSNLEAWQSGEIAKLSLRELEKMDGVVSLMLVDQFGRILAPIDQLNRSINYPIFQHSLKSGKIRIEKQDEGQYLICCPAAYSDGIKGAVLLLFKVRKHDNLANLNWLVIWGGLVVLCALAIIFAMLLVEIFLKPWRMLLASASSAIDEIESKIRISPGYKEIESAKILFERLLLRNLNNAAEVKISNKNESYHVPLSDKERSAAFSGEFYKRYKIFLVVLEENQSIIYCNPEFKKLFAIGSSHEDNMVELFADPDVYSAVSLVLEGSKEDQIVTIAAVKFSIHKIMCVDNPEYILVYFEEYNG